MSQTAELADLKIPLHIAIIMDGNGRWAKRRHLPRLEGHRNGAKTVRTIVEESRRLGVKYLTLYAFSSENWQRPKEEVWALMKLFERYLEGELDLLIKNDIRLRVIGNLAKLPDTVQSAIQVAENATAHCQSMQLVLAVSYGAREEIVAAAQKLARSVQAGEITAEAIDSESFSAQLYAPDVPDPDLLIRTSAEFRISNFLLWQLAYAEIVVTPVLWPDFGKEEFFNCIKEFSARDRRYGLTAEQLNK